MRGTQLAECDEDDDNDGVDTKRSGCHERRRCHLDGWNLPSSRRSAERAKNEQRRDDSRMWTWATKAYLSHWCKGIETLQAKVGCGKSMPGSMHRPQLNVDL